MSTKSERPPMRGVATVDRETGSVTRQTTASTSRGGSGSNGGAKPPADNAVVDPREETGTGRPTSAATETDAAGTGEATGERRRPSLLGTRWGRRALAVVAVLGIAGTAGFGHAWAVQRNTLSQETAARTTARNFLLALTNFTSKNVDAQFNEVQGFATGPFESQSNQFFGSSIRQQLEAALASSRGQIRDLYVQSVSGNAATVYGVVDQTYVPERPGDVRVIADQVAGPHQEVVIGDHAAPAPLVGVVEDQGAQVDRERRHGGDASGGQQGLRLAADGGHRLPDRDAGVDPIHHRPVALVPRRSQPGRAHQLHQGCQGRILVRCRPEPGRDHPQRIHPPVKRVGLAAGAQQRHAPLHVLTQGGSPPQRRGSPSGPLRRREQVPVGVELVEELEQPVRIESQEQSPAHHLATRLPRPQGVEPAVEPLLGVDGVARLHQGLEVGREAGLQGVQPQQRRAERVDGLDAGSVHLRHRPSQPEALLLRDRAGAGPLLQRLADPDPQLPRGRDREGDRREPLHAQPPGRDPGRDPGYQLPGLPGPGSRLDEEGPVQLGGEAVALRLVGDGEPAHRAVSRDSGWRAR